MPTLEQWEDNADARFELYRGDPQLKGYPEPDNSGFTGPTIGTIEFDPETNRLKINRTEKDSPKGIS